MPKKQEEGEDPDPTPYLFVSLEQKRIDQTKPYDAKKSCWVPDDKEGFVLGEIRGTKGDLVTVGIPGGEVKKLYYQYMQNIFSARFNKLLLHSKSLFCSEQFEIRLLVLTYKHNH